MSPENKVDHLFGTNWPELPSVRISPEAELGDVFLVDGSGGYVGEGSQWDPSSDRRSSAASLSPCENEYRENISDEERLDVPGEENVNRKHYAYGVVQPGYSRTSRSSVRSLRDFEEHEVKFMKS